MNDVFNITINKIIQVTREDISNLLCSAFEGGSTYWIDEVKIVKSAGDYKYASEHGAYGGKLSIHDEEDDAWYTFDDSTIKQGLEAMAERCDCHFDNIINDNTDAETADAFLQCCLFGDIVYG